MTAFAEIAITSLSCPLQFEGRWLDGRPFYFRARDGRTALHVGPAGGTIESAVDTNPCYELERDDWTIPRALEWCAAHLEFGRRMGSDD